MTLPRLGAPLTVGMAGLLLLYLMARFDGAQSERLHELDVQQATLAAQTIHASQARRAVQAQSEATDRENARLRSILAQREAAVAHWRRLADSAGAALGPVLAALPDSVSHPVLRLLALKDSVIATQDSVIHDLHRVLHRLEDDRDRWREMDGRDAQLATQWETQAGRWRKESRRGCVPLFGCISRTAVALVAGGLGVAGGIVLGR